jgi:glycosyltransferase involved in cell wall biosynthesis
VESVLNQTYPAPYDVIVVENGSTDDTTRIVERYPVRLFHSTERGPAPARNTGIAHSEAEVVAFTDSDCIAAPDWLSELMRPYADPQVGGVGGAILAHAHGDRNHIEMFSDEFMPLKNFASGEHEFLPHLYTANASYRRRLLDEIGGFNPRLVTGQDVDVAWRLQLLTGAALRYAPQAVIYHHHRETVAGLARQYRRYGFGEILLDTMYGRYPGYPRNLRFQTLRLLGQMAALPRYLASAVLRQLRRWAGRATSYEAVVPQLWFMIESNNIRGKLEGLAATRLMTDARPALGRDAGQMIARLYGGPSR